MKRSALILLNDIYVLAHLTTHEEKQLSESAALWGDEQTGSLNPITSVDDVRNGMYTQTHSTLTMYPAS